MGWAQLITDPPPISFTTLSEKKRKEKKNTCDMWHVTRDMWHVTRDMWQVTRDTWHVTHLGGWTFSQNFSSLALTICDLWYYEDLEEKDDWLNQWMNELISDKTVYRTAPATPGLLIIILLSHGVILFGFRKGETENFIYQFRAISSFLINLLNTRDRKILFTFYCELWLEEE